MDIYKSKGVFNNCDPPAVLRYGYYRAEDISPGFNLDMSKRAKEPPKPPKGVRFQGQSEKPETSAKKPPAGVTPDFYGLKPKPPRQPLSSQEKAQVMREATWDKAPSVHTHMTIPINAPPVEAVLKTGSDSVPALSLGVLTPTEQQRMRMDYYVLRNTALQRSQKCPYRGCSRVFKINDVDRLQQHLDDIHAGEKCNFCDITLFKHWSDDQKQTHFIHKHFECFALENPWKHDDAISIRSEGRVDLDREWRWNFCARCGRDHRSLDVKADRTLHNNLCFPGSKHGQRDRTACSKCGNFVRAGKTHTHRCPDRVEEDEQPHCWRCGLPLGLFTRAYRHKHIAGCKGRNNVVDQFCPWCGISFDDSPIAKLKHLRQCGLRPPDADGPVDLATGQPWPVVVPGEQGKPGPAAAAAAGPTGTAPGGDEAAKLREQLREKNETLAAISYAHQVTLGHLRKSDEVNKLLKEKFDHLHQTYNEDVKAPLVELQAEFEKWRDSKKAAAAVALEASTAR